MDDARASSSGATEPGVEAGCSKLPATTWRTRITTAIAASITISLGIGHRSGRLRSDALSLIDMVTVLQVLLRQGGALVAVGNQMTILPKDAARLDPPRVVKCVE